MAPLCQMMQHNSLTLTLPCQLMQHNSLALTLPCQMMERNFHIFYRMIKGPRVKTDRHGNPEGSDEIGPGRKYNKAEYHLIDADVAQLGDYNYLE